MTEMDVLETAGKYRLRLVIQEDSESFNPRLERDCNLTNVITLRDQDYIDVDETGGPLQDAWDHFSYNRTDGEAVKLFTRYARYRGVTVIEDRPHNGAWALWYVMPGKLAETTWTAEKVIESEQAEYRRWAEGEVYGHIVEKDVTRIPRDAEDRNDPELDGETREWEEVDSCWGYIGREYAEEAAREAFASYAEGVKK